MARRGRPGRCCDRWAGDVVHPAARDGEAQRFALVAVDQQAPDARCLIALERARAGDAARGVKKTWSVAVTVPSAGVLPPASAASAAGPRQARRRWLARGESAAHTGCRRTRPAPISAAARRNRRGQPDDGGHVERRGCLRSGCTGRGHIRRGAPGEGAPGAGAAGESGAVRAGASELERPCVGWSGRRTRGRERYARARRSALAPARGRRAGASHAQLALVTWEMVGSTLGGAVPAAALAGSRGSPTGGRGAADAAAHGGARLPHPGAHPGSRAGSDFT